MLYKAGIIYSHFTDSSHIRLFQTLYPSLVKLQLLFPNILFFSPNILYYLECRLLANRDMSLLLLFSC